MVREKESDNKREVCINKSVMLAQRRVVVMEVTSLGVHWRNHRLSPVFAGRCTGGREGVREGGSE